jgi:glycosyltransferase involved in cell wall biosynthesis
MNWFTNIHLKFLGVPTIIDVRDNYFNYKNLTSAQVLICAAENIYQNVKKKVICGDVRHIPIPLNYNILLKNSICNIRDSKTWRLLFAATITENKGIKELISAVKLLNKKNFKYTLVIVGKNLTKKKLLENLPEYIVYKGELEQYNLYDEMRNCDLFILPSKSEGMPRVCLEAIAMGKITLLPPNIPEFDKNCKDFVLDQINPKFIAQKIEIVMSSANRKITYPIENHFPENCFKRTIKAYNSAIKYKN